MVRIWRRWMGGRTVSATETVACLSLRRVAISSERGLMDAGGNSDVMVASGLVVLSGWLLVVLVWILRPYLAQLDRRVGARM